MRLFLDTLHFDAAPRRTRDGYLVASPRAARVGIQDYAGFEVGKPELERVRVYRDEAEVFNADAVASFAHRPVTNNHPPVFVDATNWREYARGQTSGDVMRDGEFLRIPLSVMDSELITLIEDGKHEISMGYTADLDFTPGVTADGRHYDAQQRNIRGNHLAIVDKARGGAQLRVLDQKPQESKPMKIVIIDGVSVEVSETAAQLVDKLNTQLTDAQAKAQAAEAKQAEAATQVATKDAELATVRKQLADAELTPAKLDAAVKSRMVVVDAAIKIVPTLVADGKTEAEIRREVVTGYMGDEAVKGWSDDAIASSFLVIAKTAPAATTDAFADAARNRPGNQPDPYEQYNQNLNAHWAAGAKA